MLLVASVLVGVTEIVLVALLTLVVYVLMAEAKSGLNVPELKASEFKKEILLVLRNRASEFEPVFTATISDFRSPSKSATMAERGKEPTEKSTLVEKLLEENAPNAPSDPVLRKTEIVLDPLFATIKSAFPSPSKSLIATLRGLDPVVKSTLGLTLPKKIDPLLELLRNTETVFED